MMSFDGVFALFGTPVVLAGAFAAAVFWAIANRQPRTSGSLFALLLVNAFVTPLLGIFVVGNAVSAGVTHAVHLLSLILVPAACAFVIYATFRVMKIANTYGEQKKTTRLPDGLTRDDDTPN